MRNKALLGMMLVLALLVASCGAPTTTAPSTCDTPSCFIVAANKCETLSMELQEDFGLVRYAIEDCSFTKTIVSAAPGEDAEIKSLIEGKSFTCQYTQGNFDERWVTSSYLGIGDCEGELREIIAQLIIFA